MNFQTLFRHHSLYSITIIWKWNEIEVPFVFESAKIAIDSSKPSSRIWANKIGSTRSSSLISGSAGWDVLLLLAAILIVSAVTGSVGLDATGKIQKEIYQDWNNSNSRCEHHLAKTKLYEATLQNIWYNNLKQLVSLIGAPRAGITDGLRYRELTIQEFIYLFPIRHVVVLQSTWTTR